MCQRNTSVRTEGEFLTTTCTSHERVSHAYLEYQDNSDSQYRGFRNNIPALCGLIAVFFVCRTIYTRLARPRLAPDNLYRIPFSLAFSSFMLVALHGTSVLKILLILSLNFLIAKVSGKSKTGPILTWIFNIAILFLNETQDGYRYADLHPSLGYLVWFRSSTRGIPVH